MTASKRRRAFAATGVAFCLVSVAACSDDATSGTTTSTVRVSSTAAPVDDGVLRIGILLPRSGAGGPLGEPLTQAVQLAVKQINDAGGVNGAAIQLTMADEGDTIATASK